MADKRTIIAAVIMTLLIVVFFVGAVTIARFFLHLFLNF